VRLRINPNVIFERLEGEAVLLQLEGGIYYKLNGSGSRIWTLIQEHGDVDKVLDSLAGEYEVDPAVARRDVDRIVEELEGRGLIVVDRP
jgi:Coenzyme PQQ synthesis protein D (PqqD)